MLSPEDIEAIARRVLELQREQQPPQRDVLNVSEAIAFVGKANLKAPEKAFLRWRKANGLRPCAKGRYSLRALKTALEREQRKTYRHAA
jgi:hypothetical protein